ncbi:MAG: peptidylprolyl isomerase [Gemmataceae bacterium]
MRRLRFAAVAVLLFSFGGCSPKTDDGDKPDGPLPKPKVAVRPETKADDKRESKSVVVDGADVPFHKAVLLDPVSDEEVRPPDTTVAGRNVAKLFEAIAGNEKEKGLWDKIDFRTGDGKKIRYRAKVKTDFGVIEIDLLADAAPNHVRNFIALARAGYYDGLPFHRSLNQTSDGKPWHYLEGGCPKGTGEVGYGSIGYWLKPELKPGLRHEVGTVGAWHSEELETAACKFYVTLSPTPWMDADPELDLGYTIFGKIVGGLEVARTINSQPARDGAPGEPLRPVVIREVTIESRVE